MIHYVILLLIYQLYYGRINNINISNSALKIACYSWNRLITLSENGKVLIWTYILHALLHSKKARYGLFFERSKKDKFCMWVRCKDTDNLYYIIILDYIHHHKEIIIFIQQIHIQILI